MFIRSGGFICKIFTNGELVTFETSCGVMNINCLCNIFFPTSISTSMISFLVTGSRKTSNSSITRKGVSSDSPRASKRAIVLKKRKNKFEILLLLKQRVSALAPIPLTHVNDFSPPLKALTSFCWLFSSKESFWTTKSSSLFSWSKVTAPLDPLILTYNKIRV